ncbi:unnamed protein product [Closterium sp. NIES-54]
MDGSMTAGTAAAAAAVDDGAGASQDCTAASPLARMLMNPAHLRFFVSPASANPAPSVPTSQDTLLSVDDTTDLVFLLWLRKSRRKTSTWLRKARRCKGEEEESQRRGRREAKERKGRDRKEREMRGRKQGGGEAEEGKRRGRKERGTGEAEAGKRRGRGDAGKKWKTDLTTEERMKSPQTV